MEKRKKVILKKCGLVLLVLILLYILGTIMFVSVLPKMYLAHKYDTKMSDYKLVDYQPGYYSFTLNYMGFSWEEMILNYEYKKNGRQFEVEFFDFQYYDAYQMKEVSQWITEELQENIDENIDFVNVSSRTVFGKYDKEKDKYKNTVWTRENVVEIIKNTNFGIIFIKTDNFEDYLIDPDELETDTYCNQFNQNQHFENYISTVEKNLYDNYGVIDDNIKSNIVLHKFDLPVNNVGFYTYEIKIDYLKGNHRKYLLQDY